MIWTALQKSVGCALQNWELQRTYPPLQSCRVEGFTEDWGLPPSDDAAAAADHNKNPTADATTDASTTRTTAPAPTQYILYQFRPAWMEQLALRVALVGRQRDDDDVCVVVRNSTCAVMELTGPLPCLQVLQDTPVMVGRYQNNNNNNAILEYLLPDSSSSSSSSSSALSERQQHASLLLETLIREQLNVCLTASRYNDSTTWEQLVRPQLQKASSVPWQAWCERLFLAPSTTTTTTAAARAAYAVLEDRLQERTYLLGTPEPTRVDCWLFDHLLQAVTDVALVKILADDCPQLLLYVERIWNRYFTTDADALRTNMENVFCAQPLFGTTSTQVDQQQRQQVWTPYEAIQHSLAPLSSSSLRVTQQQQPEEQPTPAAVTATWQLWTRGADPATLHRLHDELWISTVVVGTALLVWGVGFGR